MRKFVSIYHDRVLAFEYTLKKLLEWHYEVKKTENNDLSILKSIKLLFFVSAVNSHKDKSNHLLNNVFTDFVAMPYGHVESKIYNEIKEREGNLDYFIITNRKTQRKGDTNIDSLATQINPMTLKEIDNAVNSLKQQNSDFIALSAFELVDLSHTYYSWKKTFSAAQASGANSLKIPTEDIIHEDKSFNLQIL